MQGQRSSHRTVALAVALLLGLTACAGADTDDAGSEDAAGDPETVETGQDAESQGDDAQSEEADAADDAVPADGWDGEGPWFTIDESAEITSAVTGTTSTGTVTLLAGADPVSPEEITVPIVADVTWTIDGTPVEFAAFNIGVDQCPVPDSGDEDDIAGFRGVGLAPDGRPLNLNAGAPALAINTTYEADWRSTTTAHDWFGPAWVFGDGEMTAEHDSITVVETGEKVSGTITVTCR